MKQLESLSTCL